MYSGSCLVVLLFPGRTARVSPLPRCLRPCDPVMMAGRASHAALWPSLRATLWPMCVYAWVLFLPEKRTSRRHGMLSGTSRGRGRQVDETGSTGLGPRLAHTAPSPHVPAPLNAFPPVGTVGGGDMPSEKVFSEDLRACMPRGAGLPSTNPSSAEMASHHYPLAVGRAPSFR